MACRLLCDSMTAFCGPVVPLENMMRATSCDWTSNSRKDGNVGRRSLSVEVGGRGIASSRVHPGLSAPIKKICSVIKIKHLSNLK